MYTIAQSSDQLDAFLAVILTSISSLPRYPKEFVFRLPLLQSHTPERIGLATLGNVVPWIYSIEMEFLLPGMSAVSEKLPEST